MGLRKLLEEKDRLQDELYELHFVEHSPELYLQRRSDIEYKIACIEEQMEFRVDRYYSDRIYDFNNVYLMSIEGSKIVTIDDWGEYDNLEIGYIYNIDFLMNILRVIENSKPIFTQIKSN